MESQMYKTKKREFKKRKRLKQVYRFKEDKVLNSIRQKGSGCSKKKSTENDEEAPRR